MGTFRTLPRWGVVHLQRPYLLPVLPEQPRRVSRVEIVHVENARLPGPLHQGSDSKHNGLPQDALQGFLLPGAHRGARAGQMQRALLLPVDPAAPVTATVTQQVESLLPHLSLLLAIPGLKKK